MSDSLNKNILAEWRPGDTILDRYRVEKIFSGAMGKVYISEHLGWKVPVAIKAPRPEILKNPEGLRRIITEANSWVRMGMHPNVATCYYVLNIKNTPYLFIEYVDGGDLSSWLKTGRCNDQRTLLNLAVQFCHGMEFTHSKGIIHRDIKPGNILLTKNSLLKITDFGIVQTINEENKGLSLTQTSSDQTIGFRGTPSYASPEQFRDTHNVDFRTDIFSFGICLWLMFCGRRPLKNNAEPGKAIPSPADSKSPFPLALQKLLSKVIAYDPKDRFQNFKELRTSLNDIHINLFRVPSPFMDLDFSDLQADNLNNRAISFFELGKVEEGKKCLQRSLDINDTLPEAIFNHTLFNWKEGVPQKILFRQVEASVKRLPEAKVLKTLAQAIRCELNKDVWDIPEEDEDPVDTPVRPPQKTYFPEYLLCKPKNSTDIFQGTQISKAAKENISDLLKKKRYKECCEILFKVWENKKFNNDFDYTKTYEDLLKVGTKKRLRAVIRLKTLRESTVPPQKIVCLPGKQKIFSLCKDGKILLHTPKEATKVQLLGNYHHISAIALSPDGTHIAFGHKDGKIELISLLSGKRETGIPFLGHITAVAVNKTNTFVAAGSSDGRIQSCFLDTRKVIWHSTEEGRAITSLGCYNKSDDFISGSEDGTMRFWSLNETEPIRIVKAHAKAVSNLSPADNNLFFISNDNKQIKIWDRQTGQCKKSLAPEEDDVTTAMVLSDNNSFVSAGRDDIIKIWQTSSDTPEFLLDGRGNGITSLSPGPYPHIFLAGCTDGSIIAWMLIYDFEFSR